MEFAHRSKSGRLRAFAFVLAGVAAVAGCGAGSQSARPYRGTSYGGASAVTVASVSGGSGGDYGAEADSTSSRSRVDESPSAAMPTGSGVTASFPSPQAPSAAARTMTGVVTQRATTTPPATTSNSQASREPARTPDTSTQRMLIYTASMALMVDQVTASIDRAVAVAIEAGGFLAQRTDNSVQLRIPSPRFRDVFASLERLGDVQSRSVQAEDVSEQFHDLEVQLTNLRSVQHRLQEFLTRANNITEMLNVERELERISAQIDQIEGRMHFLQNRAQLSTISLALSPRPVVVLHGPDPVPHATMYLPSPQMSLAIDWLRELGLPRLLQLR